MERQNKELQDQIDNFKNRDEIQRQISELKTEIANKIIRDKSTTYTQNEQNVDKCRLMKLEKTLSNMRHKIICNKK